MKGVLAITALALSLALPWGCSDEEAASDGSNGADPSVQPRPPASPPDPPTSGTTPATRQLDTPNPLIEAVLAERATAADFRAFADRYVEELAKLLPQRDYGGGRLEIVSHGTTVNFRVPEAPVRGSIVLIYRWTDPNRPALQGNVTDTIRFPAIDGRWTLRNYRTTREFARDGVAVPESEWPAYFSNLSIGIAVLREAYERVASP